MHVRNTIRSSVDQLEAREVPAVGAFADIMPGIWGSYPREFTTSGDKLYFVANNGHGEEVYVSDGTAKGTSLVKELRPGSAGADPQQLVGDGKGALYYWANDGTWPSLWKTNGTKAGTFKVPGVPADGNVTMGPGLNGALYYSVASPTGSFSVCKSDGGPPVHLVETAGPVTFGEVKNGQVYFSASSGQPDAGPEVWVTNGTPQGTMKSAPAGAVTNPGNPPAPLIPFAELSTQKWLYHVNNQTDWGTQLWVRDSAYDEPRLLKSFDAVRSDSGGLIGTATQAYAITAGGKAYFTVLRAGQGLAVWATDGTTEGTKQLPALLGGRPRQMFAAFGTRVLTEIEHPNGSHSMALTNGTAAGTSRITAPDGGSAVSYLGRIAGGPEAPNGWLVFRTREKVFITNGTPGGTRWVDAAGVPESGFRTVVVASLDRAHYTNPEGAIYKGAVYFQGPRVGDVRPEPWKWDLVAPTTPPASSPAPAVTSVVVNDGAAQRSMVTKVTVTFDRAVDFAAGAFDLRSTVTNTAVQLVTTTQLVNGKTVATLTFTGAGIVGGSLADGIYKLTVKGSLIRTAGTTIAATGDHVTTLHRFFGDINGDRAFDRASRWMLYERLGSTRGSAAYMAEFDYDGDGDIDHADEWQLLQRYGKTL